MVTDLCVAHDVVHIFLNMVWIFGHSFTSKKHINPKSKIVWHSDYAAMDSPERWTSCWFYTALVSKMLKSKVQRARTVGAKSQHVFKYGRYAGLTAEWADGQLNDFRDIPCFQTFLYSWSVTKVGTSTPVWGIYIYMPVLDWWHFLEPWNQKTYT